MQAQDVMTRDVRTTTPQTSVADATRTLTGLGVAALPVLDADGALVGMVGEVDLVRDRLPADPRLRGHGDPPEAPVPADTVAGVMTASVQSTEGTADLSEVAALLVATGVRSLPVTSHGRLVGIVSRRDLLRTLIRDDAAVHADVLSLVETYTAEPGAFSVTVHRGRVAITRRNGPPMGSRATESRALGALARTIGGVQAVQVE